MDAGNGQQLVVGNRGGNGSLTGSAAAPAQPVVTFSRDQIELLKATICKDATDDELRLFCAQCQRLNLDPFMRQIHAVKRWNSELKREVMSIQVGIDGFRLVAQRTGQYCGQTPAQWCGPDGQWVDVWLADEPPVAARIGVYRTGFLEPLYAVARTEAYIQRRKDGEPIRMWKTMPDVMISKCAEGLALRRAFPAELSGVYTPDEMGQADNPEPETRSLPRRAEAAPAARSRGPSPETIAGLRSLSHDPRVPEASRTQITQRLDNGAFTKTAAERTLAAGKAAIEKLTGQRYVPFDMMPEGVPAMITEEDDSHDIAEVFDYDQSPPRDPGQEG